MIFVWRSGWFATLRGVRATEATFGSGASHCDLRRRFTKMLPARCQEAHRLFLTYIAALSDRNRADRELLEVLRTGTGEEFRRARKTSEEAYGGAGQARAEYIRH